MSTTPPPVMISLSQAEQDLVTGQANLATVLEAIDTENESFEAEITPLNTQAASLPAQIGYFMQQANSGQYMDKNAAATQLAAAQASLASVRASIASATATHVANLAALTVQQTEAAAQVSFLQRTIQQILSSITVTISPKPASIANGSVTEFSATVEGDPNNAGVTWQIQFVRQGSGYGRSIGTLSNASGTSVTYTAPTTPAGVPGQTDPNRYDTYVMLIATSVTNSTIFDTLVIFIPTVMLPDGRPGFTGGS